MPQFPTMLKSPDLILGLSSNGIVARTGTNTYAALSTPLDVSYGGTGINSYASGDLIYGNGSGTLSKLADPGLPGYVLSALGGAPLWVQLSTLTATTITGTANQVLVNGTSGVGQTGPVTLTLPQDIHTGATPQFSGLGIGVAANLARASILIGTHSAGSNDAQVLVSRLVDNAATGNGHSFADFSLVTRSGTVAHNSYDAGVEFSGSNNFDHYAAFQSRPNINISGTISDVYGLVDTPTVSAGTITNRFGVDIFDVAGAGSVVNNYGIRIKQLSVGTTLNYAILTEGTTPSHFNGPLISGTSLTSPIGTFKTVDINRIGDAANAAFLMQADAGKSASIRFTDGIGSNKWEMGRGADTGGSDFELYGNAVGHTVMVASSSTGVVTFADGVRTGAPSGGSAQPWKLGNYTAGAAAQAGTVRVEINGVAYDLLTA